MGSKFRYNFGKVLGTQNHLTLGSTSTHCVLHLNLIKGTFDIAFYTHIHTSIHLRIQHDISSRTLTYIYHASHIIIGPSIHLSWQSTSNLAYIYHSYYLIQGSKQARYLKGNKMAAIKQTCLPYLKHDT